MKIPGADLARRCLWAAASSPVLPNRHRYPVLRRIGLTHADGIRLGPRITFVDPSTFRAGAGTYINAEVFIDLHVTLGRRVFIGPRALLVTGKHPIGGPERRAADGAPAPISVGDGSWIGAGATVLPGVSIGAGCVIGAGAVVTKDCEPHGLYAGVPARRIRDLPRSAEER